MIHIEYKMSTGEEEIILKFTFLLNKNKILSTNVIGTAHNLTTDKMMRNLILLTILIAITSCNKNDHQELNCTNYRMALLDFNSEALNVEVNKLTVDLLPNQTESDKTGHHNNFDELVKRLNDSCPDIRAIQGCYACIKTLPLQSEIKIELDSSGIQVERTIDISTPDDDMLKSSGLHGG